MDGSHSAHRSGGDDPLSVMNELSPVGWPTGLSSCLRTLFRRVLKSWSHRIPDPLRKLRAHGACSAPGTGMTQENRDNSGIPAALLALGYFRCLILMKRSGALSPTSATARKAFNTVLGFSLRRIRQRMLGAAPPAVSRQRCCTRGLDCISRI